MATSSSRPRQSTASNRQSRVATTLPVYQPPSHPLNETAQRALQTISQSHHLKRLKTHLNAANHTLSNCAAEVNDRYYHKSSSQQRRKARRAQQGLEYADDEQDQALEKMRIRVEDMTSKLEQGIRKIIDARATVEATEKALLEVHSTIVSGGGAIAPTQSTLGASQFRSRQRPRAGSIDDGSEDETSQTQVQDPSQQRGPTSLLKQKLQDHDASYNNLSLRTRYANHNDYISFKKLTHDALHPGDDAPPLPNASTWFPSAKPSHPTQPRNPRPSAAANPSTEILVEDSSSDLEVASERISIKCPLTLLPMRKPLSSKKCPHSFEEEAILEMISNSTLNADGTTHTRPKRGATQQNVEKAVKCPVCEVILTPLDLFPNPVLIRKIARLHAAQALQNNPDSDSDTSSPAKHERGTQRQAEEVESDDDDNSASARRKSTVPRIKAERLASEMRMRASSRVPDSQGSVPSSMPSRMGTRTGMIVDLGEEEEDEEEEEEEEEVGN